MFPVLSKFARRESRRSVRCVQSGTCNSISATCTGYMHVHSTALFIMNRAHAVSRIISVSSLGRYCRDGCTALALL